MSNEFEYDVFLSHASADKDYVRTLAEALKAKGKKVWFDEFALRPGDSLRRSIDKGLDRSRFGIVVLSRNFFQKEWTQKELDGLVSREDGQGKVIIPVWHGITANEVRRFSPTLADRIALSSAKPLAEVVDSLLKVIDCAPRDEGEGDHGAIGNGEHPKPLVNSIVAAISDRLFVARGVSTDRTISVFFVSFFYAIVAALAGGFLWNLVKPGIMGGRVDFEPHGFDVVNWTWITLLPVSIAIICLTLYYKLFGLERQLFVCGLFLFGMLLGATFFYDVPVAGVSGIRAWFDTLTLSFKLQESILVVIWSLCLAVPGFTCALLAAPWTSNVPKKRIAAMWLLQVGICVGITVIGVMIWIWTTPPDAKQFGPARGIIAGVLLRLSIFFGLLLYECRTHFEPSCSRE